MTALSAPFPWFGGKARAQAEIWRRFGPVKQYVEPFLGSAVVALNAPTDVSQMTLGDQDRYLINFWRVMHFQPDEVATLADYPVSHIDLHARHRWLVRPDVVRELDAQLVDPRWPGDAQLAAWWVWGICAWIGDGWCRPTVAARESEKIPHTIDPGKGVHRFQIPHSGAWQGMQRDTPLLPWFRAISAALRRAVILHGDWSRCVNVYYGTRHATGGTGIFFDPPYPDYEAVYSAGNDAPVALQVAEWCREHQSKPNLKIAICGHEGDYDLPGWSVWSWVRGGSTYGGTKTQKAERIWFSPQCENQPIQGGLF